MRATSAGMCHLAGGAQPVQRAPGRGHTVAAAGGASRGGAGAEGEREQSSKELQHDVMPAATPIVQLQPRYVLEWR